ncbi:hypothetical protein [Glycomyces arizonensis]|uniref:hypothetical protein n=1 Tax=Glycomyces arizonensis TaxID=256035 RepID=UPI0004099120|nr:hypothetical protein [Glycomyces arizonensis]
MQEGRIGIDLTSIAGVDLYRGNAFRLSGLPVDASLRRVRRRSTEIEAADRLGAELPSPGGPLPVDPPPASTEILDALRRLHDPTARIVDEFLWLWPEPAAAGEADEARAVALHNLAVTAHVSALEDDYPDGAVEEKWGAVYRRWNQVLEEEACWRRLARRVEALADPQLRTTAVDRLRLGLPELVLSTHAGLAVADFARDRDRGLRQADAMLGSDHDDAMIDRALLGALGPQVSRLKALAEQTKDAAGDHEAYQRTCQAALEGSAADLAALRTLVCDENAVVSGIADDLASGVRECVVGAMNRIPEDEAVRRRVEVAHAIRWLDLANGVAVGDHVRERIGEDLQTLLSNLVVAACRAAQEESRRSPASGITAQRSLVEQTRKPLRRIMAKDRGRYFDLCDEVAGTAFLILLEYANVTGEGRAVLPELRSLLRIAHDPKLRDQLTRAVHAFESGGPDTGRRGASRSVWSAVDASADACAMCERTATGSRTVVMGHPQRYGEALAVTVPSCGRCHRKRLNSDRSGCLIGLLFLAAIVLGLVVLFSSLTWSATDAWFGWMVVAVALLGYVSERGEKRRRRLGAHPEIRRRLSEGWRIAN